MTTDLVAVDRDAVSVVSMLENAKSWLATAVETTGPAEIASAKAQIVTAETYAHELGLSREIQEDAREMVRRAEYALGKAIRKGQEEGTVLRRGQMHSKIIGQETVDTRNMGKLSPQDFAPGHELFGQAGLNNGIYGLADDVEPEQFEDALTEAKAEGNLSRANVVRKVKKKAPPNKSRAAKADILEDLARQGFSSRQMCKALGFSRDNSVRDLAREFDIEIPADKAINNTRRINSTDVVANTVSALEGLVMGVELIDYDALDLTEVSHWADSLHDSLGTLNKFSTRIRKAAQ